MNKSILKAALIATTVFSASTVHKANANLPGVNHTTQVQTLLPALAISTTKDIIPTPLKASDFVFQINLADELEDADFTGLIHAYCSMPDDEEMRERGFTLMDKDKWMRSDAIVLFETEDGVDEGYMNASGIINIVFKSVYDAKRFMKTIDDLDWDPEGRGNLNRRYSCGEENCVSITRKGKVIEIFNDD